jgi:hypothetical protein
MDSSTTTATTAVAVLPVLFTREEELTIAGFLAGYGGLTREAYTLDLRQYVSWCTEHRVSVFGARRSDIESFGRDPKCASPSQSRSPGRRFEA